MKNIKDEKEYFNLEFKIKNDKSKNEAYFNKIDKKNIKEIFYKNDLHIYDLNDDGMNRLSNDKIIKAKLRKNKKDANFEKNYKKIFDFLENKGIKIEKSEIINENNFQNKVVKRKRKGTPGKVLYDNRFHKDENTKINTGRGSKILLFKKGKNILPQKKS